MRRLRELSKVIIMLSYSEMVCLAKEVQEQLSGALFEKAQIFQGDFIQLSFQDHSSLIVSMNKGRVAFYLDRFDAPPLDNRFCSQVNEHLAGYRLTQGKMIDQDRILKLLFEHKGKRKAVIVELFPHRPVVYLLDHNDQILACSRNEERKIYSSSANPKENQLDSSIQCTSRAIAQKIRHSLVQEEQQALLEKLELLQKKLVHQKTIFARQLHECQGWEKVHHEGELMQTYFHQLRDKQGEVEVDDFNGGKIVLHLEKGIPLPKQLEKKFKQAGKLKRGLTQIPDLIKKNDRDLELLEQKMEEVRKWNDLKLLRKELGKFEKKTGEKKKDEKHPFKKYITKNGFVIYAGRSDLENEKLTFSFADGSDYWLHVSNYPGSHVVIKNRKDRELDSDSLQDGLMVAIFHSKAKNLKDAEVTFTRVKELRKVKGKVGKVQVASHKNIRAIFDNERFKRLVSQKGPHPLL